MLNYSRVGRDLIGAAKDGRSPVFVLHGLFGSSQNWNSISKSLSSKLGRDVIALDLTNHGQSPHTSTTSYDEMALDVSKLVQSFELTEAADFIGHSMGGKVLMHLNLQDQSFIRRSVIVDIAPVKYPSLSPFTEYIAAMLSMPAVKSMSEADLHLKAAIPEKPIRQFLLTNLKVKDGKYKFQLNLEVLRDNLKDLSSFPATKENCSNEMLFIKGQLSDYIDDNGRSEIKRLFTNSRVHVIPEAGHWVQAEKPREFLQVVSSFLLT